MELQAIPFTAIAEYFRIYSLEDFDEFAYIIRLMDNTFLEQSDAVNKSEGNKNASGNANTPNNNKR